jgi:O-antigen ligase
MVFTNSFVGTLLGRNFDFIISANVLASFSYTLGIVTLVHFFLLGRLNNELFRFVKLDIWLIVFVLIVVITSLIGIDFDKSLPGILRYPSFIILYILTRIIFTNKHEFINFISFSLGILLTIFIFNLSKILTSEIYPTLGNFIFFIPPTVAVVYFKAIEERKLAWKLWIVILLFGSILMLVTESRRILLAIAITWIGILRVFRVRLSILIVLVIVAIGGFVLLGEMERYDRTFVAVKDIASGNYTKKAIESVSTGRYGLWEAGFKMIRANPVTGVGLNNHTTEILQYGTTRSQRIHNVFLDTAAQAGIGALLVLLIIIAKMWTLINRSMVVCQINSDNFMYLFLAGLKISLVALLVISFFGGSLIMDKFGWFQFGLIIAACKNVNSIDNFEA